jgi:Xaa-Pro aminopeptidase
MTAAPYFQTDFPPAEFAERRARVAAAIGAGAVAVLQGAGATGAFDLFRQTNDFYYLCGVEVPQACLLIEGGTGRSVLYLPHLDPKHERSEGPYLNCDDAASAVRLTGVDAVRQPEALAVDARPAAAIFVPTAPAEGRQASRDTLRFARKEIDADPWDRQPAREATFAAKLREASPPADFRDLSPILDALRVIKSPREQALMRRAGRLCAMAVREAISGTRPGAMEYELSAIADYVYSVNGAKGPGYRAIVAGGSNIWNAHYWRNNCRLTDGDLVLMDVAPDVGCYTSDIGRMWPVNGRYSPVQRELYGFMVEYHRALMKLIRPGVTVDAIHRAAAEAMTPRIAAARWSKDVYRQAAQEVTRFTGHCSHGVGMAVHDVGDYKAEPLRPGVVFALDPQMWVNSEKVYVRVEDTVLVTPDGCESLTAAAPLDLDEVEATIRRPGMLQAYPPASL